MTFKTGKHNSSQPKQTIIHRIRFRWMFFLLYFQDFENLQESNKYNRIPIETPIEFANMS